jgi:hypothetical protein
MRKSILLIIAALFIYHSLYAQVKVFAGHIVDEAGNPLAGVSVFIKGSRTGTSTDADGKFKINIAASSVPCTLLISYVGFESKEIKIGKKDFESKDFRITLSMSGRSLDEVVVVGFSAMKKSDVTGSVSKVMSSESKVYYGYTSVVSSESLKGKSSGIQIGETKAPPVLDKVAKVSEPGYEKPAITTALTETKPGRSKVLTAGEVNDFSKWKLWEGYTEKEFESHSKNWQIKPARRYSVQLVNKSKTAMVNEKVYLIDPSVNDTLWRGFTDNTGKAELWDAFFQTTTEKRNVVIADGHGNRVSNPTEFVNGMNLLSVNQSCNVSNDVDIAFVVDATGSMRDEIDYLKEELEDVIKTTMSKYEQLSLRTASVFYRDKGDQYLTRHIDFSNDLSKTVGFVKAQMAGGGGDFPEAVDEALAVTLDSLHWNASARARLVFLVLDAPPHEQDKQRMKGLITRAAAKGIRVIPIGCSGIDKSTEFLLRSVALATNGTYAFLTDHSGVGNAHIEATTDKYDVELLNALMQRLIRQFIYAPECNTAKSPVTDTRQADNILSVRMFPNPTSGRFTIDASKELKEIYITDFTGKILMRISDTPTNKNWKVDIGQYPSGVYFVKYVTKDDKWGAEKIVLMR